MAERRVALLLRIRRELKEQLVDFAEHQHRSLNQQIEFILERFLADVASKAREEAGEEHHGKKRQN